MTVALPEIATAEIDPPAMNTYINIAVRCGLPKDAIASCIHRVHPVARDQPKRAPEMSTTDCCLKGGDPVARYATWRTDGLSAGLGVALAWKALTGLTRERGSACAGLAPYRRRSPSIASSETPPRPGSAERAARWERSPAKPQRAIPATAACRPIQGQRPPTWGVAPLRDEATAAGLPIR